MKEGDVPLHTRRIQHPLNSPSHIGTFPPDDELKAVVGDEGDELGGLLG